MQFEKLYIMPFSIKSERLDILELIKLFDDIKNSNVKKAILDYQNTHFFAVELFGFYRFQIKKLLDEYDVEIIAVNVREDVDSVNHLSDTNHYDTPKHKTAILFRNFEHDLSLNRYDCFDDYMQKEFLPKFIQNDDIRSIIMQYLSELFVNSRTHGHTKNIICGGQIYKKNNKIKIVFVDFGVTIPYNIENYEINGLKCYFKKNDGGSIRWSTLPGNSTKKVNAGGLGLNSINEFIDTYDGRILIISRYGSYERKNKIDKTFNCDIKLDGTLVVIELDLIQLKKINKPKLKNDVFSI